MRYIITILLVLTTFQTHSNVIIIIDKDNEKMIHVIDSLLNKNQVTCAEDNYVSKTTNSEEHSEDAVFVYIAIGFLITMILLIARLLLL